MALKLEKWLGGPDKGPSAESWLRQQLDYALWQEKQKGDHPIRKAAVA